MQDIFEKKGPIGAWVKKADEVFTNLVRKSRENGTFNRLEWQYFNLLKEKEKISRTEALNFLSFFDKEENITKVVTRFQNEGLVEAHGQELVLSAKGAQVYREVLEIQEEIKKKSIEEIDEAQYATTVETLEKIMNNLRAFTPDETYYLNKKREEIIHNYVDAYNSFDIQRMTVDFHETVKFENISNGVVDMTLEGLSAFKEQAELAKGLFLKRRQIIKSFSHQDNRTEIQVSYNATLATDLPNGLKKGDEVNLEGKSVFVFSGDQIMELTDMS